jgi:hypothetical protein
MEQGVELWFENGTLTVFPRNEIYIRNLANNRKVIGELASEFFGCAVKVDLAEVSATLPESRVTNQPQQQAASKKTGK